MTAEGPEHALWHVSHVPSRLKGFCCGSFEVTEPGVWALEASDDDDRTTLARPLWAMELSGRALTRQILHLINIHRGRFVPV